jgi:flagellar hook-length control protein FliK
MTSIADVLPLPSTQAPAPTTTGTGGATGAPVAVTESDTETEAAAPADAFAAMLAAVVAAVVTPPPVVTDPSPVPTSEAPAVDVTGIAPVLATLPLLQATAAAPVAQALTQTAEGQQPVAVAPVLAEEMPSAAEASVDIDIDMDLEETATVVDELLTVETPDAPHLEVTTLPPVARAVVEAEVEVDLAATAVAPAVVPEAPTGDEAPAPEAPEIQVTTTVAPANTAPAPARAEAPSPVVATPAPRAPEPPHQQVVSHVTPLLHGPDGDYRVSVRLHPHELGAVQVDVQLQDGRVHLRLQAETETGLETLRESLPALRRELEAAGVSAGSLDLSAWGEQQQGTPTPRRDPAAPAFSLDGAIEPEPIDSPTPDADGDAAVDVRM